MSKFPSAYRQHTWQSAYIAGQHAVTSLKIGDVFTGAMPAAIATGHDYNAEIRRAFIDGYTEAMHERWPHGIVTDTEGRII